MHNSKVPVMRTLKYYFSFTLLLLILSSLIIPTYYGLSYPKKPGPLFSDSIDMTYQQHIIENKPSLVLLGDSTLEDSIDESYLTELLGQETFRIGQPGSASAIWYLILKNNIATSSVKPKHLVIFSRASMLTTPEYRTTGKYEESIVNMALPEDTLVIERAYLSQMNSLEKRLDYSLPIYGYRAYVRKSIENLFKYSVPKQIWGVRPKDVEDNLKAAFGNPEIVQLSNMITMAETYTHAEERLDFNAQLPQSFLPEIVRICQENDIQLTLVYTQTIYTDQSAETANMLAIYRSDLFQYAVENNIQVLDYLGDERVAKSFFNDPVHMNAEGRHNFTEIFATDFSEFLP